MFLLLRRLIAAVLLLAATLCVVEVALRFQRTRTEATAVSQYGAAPSRITLHELPRMAMVETASATDGQRHRWQVNSFGLRGPEPAIPKPTGSVRIVCLGDETILAPRLAEADTCPAQLGQLVAGDSSSAVEVINAGLPSGCPLTAAIEFRRTLMALAPDLVVVHVDVTDARDDQQCRPYLRLDASGIPLAVVHPSFDIPDSPLCGWDNNFALIDWARGCSMERCVPPREQSGFDGFQASLRAWEASSAAPDKPHSALAPLAVIQQLLKPQGGELVVCHSPNAWQTVELLRGRQGGGGASGIPADLLQQPTAALRQATSQMQIPFVDATPAFLSHPSPRELFLPDTGRLSPAGQALYAETIARFLTQPTQ